MSSLIIYIFFTLLASAFFSGMEIAFISSNKLEMELAIKNSKRSGNILTHFFNSPGMFIGTMLLGNNISLVIYGILMASVFEPVILNFISSPGLVLFIQVVFSTMFILFAAEFIPKVVFQLNPKRWLVGFSWLLGLIYYLLWLPTKFTIGLSEWILETLFRVKVNSAKYELGRIDLNNLVRVKTENKNNSGDEIEPEIEIFQNALDFRDVKVRESMSPRNEIEAIDISESNETVIQKFISTGHSKVLVYRGSIDNIIGYVHSLEMFKNPDSIKKILRPISIVPEATPAKDVLQLFIKEKKNIAVVVDEYGGTAGMVTLEDLVEEIFGEIEDEHDKEDLTERKIDDKNYIFSARHEVNYLNDEYELGIPEEDDYETLAGYIIYEYEGLPSIGTILETDDYIISILKIDGPKIEEVQFTLKQSVEG
jgi:CBS domain containing-hemolysin-like protein